MKELVFVCLFLQVCLSLGQTPVKPTLPETFVASGEVEVHEADETGFGDFVIARDETAQMGLERETYDHMGRRELSEALYRYDMNTTYYLRGDIENPHCLVEDRKFDGMPMYWRWLENANYEGLDEVHEVNYDLWAVNIGGVRYEFGKPTTNASILYTYRRKSAELSVLYSILKFEEVTPESSMFDIPQQCKDAMNKKY